MPDAIHQYDAAMASAYSAEARMEHPQNSLPYDALLRGIHQGARSDYDGQVRLGADILDLACGSGYLTRMLKGRNPWAAVYGVDISPEMIALARKEEETNRRGIWYEVANCADSVPPLRLAPGGGFRRDFDVVTAAFLLNYASNEQVLMQMLKTAHENLTVGGKFVGTTTAPKPVITRQPNASHSSAWIDKPFGEGSRLKVLCYDMDGNDLCEIVCHYWSPQTYERCFAAAGFRDFEWIGYQATDSIKQFRNWRSLVKSNATIAFSASKGRLLK